MREASPANILDTNAGRSMHRRSWYILYGKHTALWVITMSEEFLAVTRHTTSRVRWERQRTESEKIDSFDSFTVQHVAPDQAASYGNALSSSS